MQAVRALSKEYMTLAQRGKQGRLRGYAQMLEMGHVHMCGRESEEQAILDGEMHNM